MSHISPLSRKVLRGSTAIAKRLRVAKEAKKELSGVQLVSLRRRGFHHRPTGESLESLRQGQYLRNENILLDCCQDQINQAVGRNRGFRQSQKDTKTVAIADSDGSRHL